MNKYVTFSIRTSKVWHAHSIWMLCPMVYWLFLVAFSQNRTLASAGHPSLATTVVRQAEEALLFQEKTLAWAVNYGITSKGERSGQSVTCTKCFLRSFVCHLFKGNGVIHYWQKNSVLDLQEHLAPFPSGHCILPLSFQPCSFLLIYTNK